MKAEETAAGGPSTHEDELPVSELGAPLANLAFGTRYEQEDLLGEGGMGAVRLYRDRQIGRRVAMKTLRAEHRVRPQSELRFVREARVQGQLEHPSIVPVHELGVDPVALILPQLEEVRPTLLALLRAVREHRPIPGPLQHVVQELRQRQDPDP